MPVSTDCFMTSYLELFRIFVVVSRLYKYTIAIMFEFALQMRIHFVQKINRQESIMKLALTQ